MSLGTENRHLPPLLTTRDMPVTNFRSHSMASSSTSPQTIGKSRTSHACDRCRAMRTKCTGGVRCTKCVKDDAICVYGDRKRERNRKDLVESIDKIQMLQNEKRILASMLQRLSTNPSLSEDDQLSIQTLLSKVKMEQGRAESADKPHESQEQESLLQSPSETANGWEGPSGDKSMQQCGEHYTSSSIGSPGRQGELLNVVDLDHGAGVAGFVGKMSEISWMQRAREYLANQPSSTSEMSQNEISQHAAATQDLAYFMDDLNILAIDEDHVEPLQWPPYQAALILSEAYFHSTQSSCHFVLRERFFNEFQLFQHAQPPSALTERRWLAVANLLWAIGSKWLQMVDSNQGQAENHLVFYARARALGLDHRVMSDHPDVEMIQGIGLLAFYLLINGSISRARNTLGHAIRHATALGLHLRVIDNLITAIEQERRARVWYSLYSLEILIAEITGRPTSLHSEQATVPIQLLDQNTFPLVKPPASVQRDAENLWHQFLKLMPGAARDGLQSMGALARSDSMDPTLSVQHYSQHIRLCRISDMVASKLYTGAIEVTWSEIQQRVEDAQSRLEEWRVALPDNMKFDEAFDTTSHQAMKTETAMYYYSVVMILHRTCLCDIVIESESERSKMFNVASAQACVHAAISMTDLLPNDPVVSDYLRNLPWWAILHYLCQAGSVVTLELCLDCRHLQRKTPVLIAVMKKIMSYLWYLADKSRSAYRAWRIFRHLLTGVSLRYGGPVIFDLAGSYEHPPSWTEYDEQAISLLLP